jgi:anti-sigma regulatory factor (Ser/Thr protein kinase)
MALTQTLPQSAASPRDSRLLDHERGVESELQLTVPATASALPLLRAAFEPFLAAQLAAHAAAPLLQDVLLALGEAVSNVVRHAYPDREEAGPLRVRAQFTPWLLRLEVVDTGPGYDLASVPRPDFDRPRPGGYGLHLMRETMSRVSYQRATGRNTLLLEKALGAT